MEDNMSYQNSDEQPITEQEQPEQYDIADEQAGQPRPPMPAELVCEDGAVSVESVIEAVLFASDEPVSAARLISVIEAGDVRQIRQAVEKLNHKYETAGCSFRIEQIAGGYQMMTLPLYNVWLRKLMKVRTDNKLSQAAMETLAIVAYKQPIIRADIEAIRGVASGEILRSLMYKGLVKIAGRAEVVGRPMLYGTTRKFLEIFGLNSLKDLPSVEELKQPQV